MATVNVKYDPSNPRKVITGEVRASYVYVYEPRINDLSGKTEYSMVALIPKSDTKCKQALDAAVAAAIEYKWPGKKPPRVDNPVRDGDGEKPRGGEYGEECKGHWVLNLKSNSKPDIVDGSLNPLMDKNEFQSGDYCRVSISAYGYDQSGNRGISFGLNNIQVLRKGDSLGGTTRATDDFEAIEKDW